MAIKFAIRLKGVYVRNIETLRECFVGDEILEVYKDQRLFRWLDAWGYKEYTKKVFELSEIIKKDDLDDGTIIQELYDIFEIEKYLNENNEDFFELALNYYYIQDYKNSLKAFKEYFKVTTENIENYEYNKNDYIEKVNYYQDIIEELLTKIIETTDNDGNYVNNIDIKVNDNSNNVKSDNIDENNKNNNLDIVDASNTNKTDDKIADVSNVVPNDYIVNSNVATDDIVSDVVPNDYIVNNDVVVVNNDDAPVSDVIDKNTENANDTIIADEPAYQQPIYKSEIQLEDLDEFEGLDELQILQILQDRKEKEFKKIQAQKMPEKPRAFTKDDAFKFEGSPRVVIPEGFNSIDEEAFYQSNPMLREITIPSTVTSIGEASFKWSKNLIEVSIPSGVIYIGSFAFYGCINLKKVTICDGVNYIGDEAFSYCNNLEEVIIPDSVTYIGREAFYECGKLKTVSMSRKTKLEEDAFNFDITKILYRI